MRNLLIVILAVASIVLASCGGSESASSAVGSAKTFMKAWQANDKAKLDQYLESGPAISARFTVEDNTLKSAQINEAIVKGDEKTDNWVRVTLQGTFGLTNLAGAQQAATQCWLDLAKYSDHWRVGAVGCE